MAANDLTTSTLVAQYLQRSLTTAETAYVATMIEAVTARMESIAGRGFIAANYVEWYDGGEGNLVLRNWPVIHVKSLRAFPEDGITVTYSGSAAEASVAVTDSSVILFEDGAADITVDFATYETTTTIATQINAQSNWSASVVNNAPAAALYRSNITFDDTNDSEDLEVAEAFDDWRIVNQRTGELDYSPVPGMQQILVRYRAGYETAPADIQQIATEWVAKGLEAGRTDSSKASEGLGDYNYSNSAQVLDKMSEDETLRTVMLKYSDILVQ